MAWSRARSAGFSVAGICCASATASSTPSALGSGLGALGGAILTGGSTVGTLGGAAIGGLIGRSSVSPGNLVGPESGVLATIVNERQIRALENGEARWMQRWEADATYRFDRSASREQVFAIDGGRRDGQVAARALFKGGLYDRDQRRDRKSVV